MPQSAGPAEGTVTALLKRASQGDQRARDELYTHVQGGLRRLAAVQLSRERPGHTLQATSLLNDAYLHLIDAKKIEWVDRGHFFVVAAKVMRRVLIDHARARNAGKRPGNAIHLILDDVYVSGPEKDPLLISLDEALSRLELECSRAYQLVELKFFGGLDFEEAALALNVSSRTLKRDWAAAKRWLYREMSNPNAPRQG